MAWSARIGIKSLAQLCRRMGTSLAAGIDVRRTLEREAQTGTRRHRECMDRVKSAIGRGDTLPDAFNATGDYFPRFFRELVHVGDQTGNLDRVLLRLAEHYEHLVSMRRIFYAGIAWPVIQLVVAVVVVGLLIAALGWVAGITGETIDILGFGLVGRSGLLRYLIFLLFVAVVLWGFYLTMTRTRAAEWLRDVSMRIPGLSACLRVMALARMAWSLGLALDAGVDARRSMRLAIQSTMNSYYTRHANELDRALKSGQEMHVALRATAAFPEDFLDAVDVGEQSGRLPESLEKLAENYRGQAKLATASLTMVATMFVWGCVALVLIFLIFRIASFYLGVLNEATSF